MTCLHLNMNVVFFSFIHTGVKKWRSVKGLHSQWMDAAHRDTALNLCSTFIVIGHNNRIVR